MGHRMEMFVSEAWGIEGRVPFLDKEFMDVAMRINPKDKMITPVQ